MLPVLNLTLYVCGCGRYWICADWCEVWNQSDAELAQQRTIKLICIMLMENAGIDSASPTGKNSSELTCTGSQM